MTTEKDKQRAVEELRESSRELIKNLCLSHETYSTFTSLKLDTLVCHSLNRLPKELSGISYHELYSLLWEDNKPHFKELMFEAVDGDETTVPVSHIRSTKQASEEYIRWLCHRLVRGKPVTLTAAGSYLKNCMIVYRSQDTDAPVIHIKRVKPCFC